MLMARRHLRIHGRVQGVFFRASLREQAESLELKGWVRNRPDRSVEALVEGREDAVAQLIAWAHQGPPGARVDRVDVKDENWQGSEHTFQILY